MFALIVGQLRHRLAAAFALALLASFTVAAGVAVPLYTAAAREYTVSAHFGNASAADRGIAVTAELSSTAGLAATLATWAVARPTIPLFTSAAAPDPPPFWPDPRIGGVFLSALAFLLGTGWIAARMTKNATEGKAQ